MEFLAAAASSLVTGPHALRNWLVLVAGLRLLSVVLGYAVPMTLQTRVFSRTSKQQFTPLVARTFAVWTAVTCVVTLVTAFNLDNPALMATCAATFAIALAYFAMELLVYRTVSLATVALPCFFASEGVLV